MCQFDQVWDSLSLDEKAAVVLVIIGVKLRPFVVENVEAITR